MKTIGTSITKRILSPVSRGCKQNVTLSFFTIPILSILLYSACSSGGSAGADTKTGQSGPITINDYDDLKDIKKNGLDKDYRLGNDIDASRSQSDGASGCVAYTGSSGTTATCEGFEPIGNSADKFTGSFDGDGHKITNLYINSDADNVGMFGSTVDAKIEDVELEDVHINSSNNSTAPSSVGGLVGDMGGSGSVSNSSVTSSVPGSSTSSTSSTVKCDKCGDSSATGGLVGRVGGSGRVSKSSALVIMTIYVRYTSPGGAGSYTTGKSYGYVGGLVGEISGSGSVSDSYAGSTVGVIGDVSFVAGGLVGHVGGSGSVSKSSVTSDSTVTVDVTGSASSAAGGLVGSSDGSVSDSYAGSTVIVTANTSVSSATGGLVGHVGGSGSVSKSSVTGDSSVEVTGSGSSAAGGLVGSSDGIISDSYAKGRVMASNGHAGGLVGRVDGGSVSNSHATATVTAVTGSGSSLSIGGLFGQLVSGASVTGTNHFVGSNAIGPGFGTCPVLTCAPKTKTVIEGIASSEGIAGVERLPAPGNLQANVASSDDGDYTISWDVVAGAAGGYLLEESQDGGTTWNPVMLTTDTSVSHVFSNQAGEKGYAYRVRACAVVSGCSASDSESSDWTTSANNHLVRVNYLVPTGVKITDTGASAPITADIDGSYDVRWTAMPHAHSYKIRSTASGQKKDGTPYADVIISYNTSSSTTPSSPLYSFSSLPGHRDYSYEVSACNAEGDCGAASTRIGVTVTLPTVTMLASDESPSYDGTYSVSWDSVLAGYDSTHSYHLEESVPGAVTTWQDIDARGATERNGRVHFGVNLGATAPKGNYKYRVRACSDVGCAPRLPVADYLGVSFQSLGAPTLAVASGQFTAYIGVGLVDGSGNPHDGSYTLAWGSVTGAVAYKLTEDGTVIPLPPGATTSRIPAKAAASVHAYQLAACADAACSTATLSPSSSLSVITRDLTPPVLTSDESPSLDGSYEISWTSVTGAMRYVLREKKGSGSGAGVYTEVYNGTGTSWQVPSAKTESVSYFYSLRVYGPSNIYAESAAESEVAVNLNCPSATTVNWTAGTNTCLATTAAVVPNGQSVTLTDADGPLQGSATATCNSGMLSVSSSSRSTCVGGSTANSKANPIIITTYAQLKTIKNGLSKHYRLGNDIDASASWSEGASGCVAYDGSNGATATCTGFEPIGTLIDDEDEAVVVASAFKGSFDGAGHKIKKLYVNRPSTPTPSTDCGNAGLFGGISNSEIKKVGLEDVYMKGADFGVGGLVGCMYGSGSVSDSYATGDVTVSGRGGVGGLVGWISGSGSVSDSYAAVAVTVAATVTVTATAKMSTFVNPDGTTDSYTSADADAYVSNIGGLVGGSGGDDGDSLRVSNSHATGDVTVTVTVETENPMKAVISYNSTTVGGSVGGLMGGFRSPSGSVSNSYATGAVTVNTVNTGAYVGTMSGVGGLVGTGSYDSYHKSGSVSVSVSVSNSYATGDVTVSNGSQIGGLMGKFAYSNDGSASASVSMRVSNSYATGNVDVATVSYGAEVGGLVGRLLSSVGANASASGSLSVSDSYATGAVSSGGGLVGGFSSYSSSSSSSSSVSVSVSGINYFVDSSGTNGIGSGSCSSSVCVRKTGVQIAALTSTSGWTTGATGDWHFGTTTQLPAVKYVQNPTTTGPRWCGSGALPACGSLISGQPIAIARGDFPSFPIIITTYAQLKTIKNGLTKHYRLGNDIDASASWSEGASNCTAYNGSNGATATCAGFEPIGTFPETEAEAAVASTRRAFKGSFDGAGYKIEKLYVNRPTNFGVGLFGVTFNAEIKNVGVENVYMRGDSSVGGLVGYFEFGSSGGVSNSHATGDVSGRSESVGGLVGYMYGSGSVSDSYADVAVAVVATVTVTATAKMSTYPDSTPYSYTSADVDAYVYDIGGLVGGAGGDDSDSFRVSNSYAMGNVTVTITMKTVNTASAVISNNTTDIGGRVGGLLGGFRSPFGSVSNSRATGAVTVKTKTVNTGDYVGSVHRVGGLVGGLNGLNYYGHSNSGSVSVSVSDSYATGDVTVSNGSEIGGLMGDFSYSGSGSGDMSVSNSYATGNVNVDTVSNSGSVGGLVGDISSAAGVSMSVSNSYATGNVKVSGGTVGGLVGEVSHFNNSGGRSSVSNSYATGNVAVDTVSYGAVGGLVGNFRHFNNSGGRSSVSNSYATGNVAVDTVSNSSSVGGLVGGLSSSSVSNSYAAGNVTATTVSSDGSVGGLVGDMGGSGASVSGINYFVDSSGTNGIGSSGTCSVSNCKSKTVPGIIVLTSTSGWTTGSTGNWHFGTGTQFPAVLYSGTSCETISGTNNISMNEGDAKIPDCGDIIKGQR